MALRMVVVGMLLAAIPAVSIGADEPLPLPSKPPVIQFRDSLAASPAFAMAGGGMQAAAISPRMLTQTAAAAAVFLGGPVAGQALKSKAQASDEYSMRGPLSSVLIGILVVVAILFAAGVPQSSSYRRVH